MGNVERVSFTESERGLNDNAARQLAVLHSRFPGMQKDERVISLFQDPETGTVKVIDLGGSYDPVEYPMGGTIDYAIQARKSSRPFGSGTATVGPFYEAGEIWSR